MFTRGILQPAYGAATTSRPIQGASRQDWFLRGQGPDIALPPRAIMHDPSDPATWTVPVRWT